MIAGAGISILRHGMASKDNCERGKRKTAAQDVFPERPFMLHSVVMDEWTSCWQEASY